MYLDRTPLAFSQLGSSKADVYRPPYATKGYVQNVTFHNAGTSAETVTLYYDDGTSEYQWLSQSVAAKDSFVMSMPGEGFIVEPGAKVTGNADTAATVTCKFSGTEESESRVVGVESNLWCPPATPHAMDMEFDIDELDGWGVYNASDGVVGSVSEGTVDAYDTTFTTGNVVRMSQNTDSRRSWLQIQAPAWSKTFYIGKSYTLPTNILMWARMRFNSGLTKTNNDIGVSLRFFTDAGGYPQLNNNVAIFLNESDAGVIEAQSQYTTTITTGIVESSNTFSQGQALEYVAIHKVGSTYHTWVGTAAGNWIWMASYSIPFTPDMVGFSAINVLSNAPAPKVQGIDFIRFIETDKFLL